MSRNSLVDEYAESLISALRAHKRVHSESADIVDRTVRFLKKRLTDAAIHGCHHCDEPREHKSAPCWWCGLK